MKDKVKGEPVKVGVHVGSQSLLPSLTNVQKEIKETPVVAESSQNAKRGGTVSRSGGDNPANSVSCFDLAWTISLMDKVPNGHRKTGHLHIERRHGASTSQEDEGRQLNRHVSS